MSATNTRFELLTLERLQEIYDILSTSPPGAAVWGTITGTLSAQLDLQAALNAKYDASNPSGFITSAALAGYLTISSAAATYYPLTNPSGYITISSLAPYLTSATAAATYYPLTNPAGYITSASLTGYVPYTGATSDLDMGTYNVKADAVEFSQTPTDTAGVAKMVWNNTDGTLEFKLKGGNVTLQVGQEQVTRVVNKTGANLLESQYHVVYVYGAQGQRLSVKNAQADSETTSAGTLGVVTEDINNNQEGFITTSGLIHDINTTGSLQGETWFDGDILYLSATTAGGLTKTKPQAPNHIVTMGYVVYAHAIHGIIYVKVDNGYELDELHDVNTTISKTTPIDADSVLLQDTADNNIWKKLSWANIKTTLKAYFDTLYQGTLTLTTTGTSGASTLIGNTLNIPQYTGAAAPIKLLSQTLTQGSWSASGGYYVYTFSNVNIDTTCDLSVTPQNASFLTAYTAQILPYIAVSAGSATFYSLFPPQDDIVVDIVITQTS